ncbi:MAG: 3-deoxy-manno-octulosonate cytidylyltransferase [Gammaproteobacteria bacterium]|nr:MAG: 3-deoxy-manno-octulosonate cytidylyltransferase [Gammaproteobacteria bacterium]
MSHSMTHYSKTHIVIPARFASSRLPGKPLLNIHGKPMILWVAEKASQATFADDMCIATDDERIAEVCMQAGFEVVMTSKDHASGTDRLSEVVCKKGWGNEDVVINMQGDEPLVPANLLEQTKDLLFADTGAVMATLCEPIISHNEFVRPSVVKVVFDNNKRALYFSRAPIPCDRDHAMALNSRNNITDDSLTTPANAYRHLGLYAYRVKLLKEFVAWKQGTLEQLECLEQLRVLENGHAISIDVAKVNLPAGVDTQEDLDRLNAMSVNEFMA